MAGAACGLPAGTIGPLLSKDDASLVVWLSVGQSVVCGAWVAVCLLSVGVTATLVTPTSRTTKAMDRGPFWGLHRAVAFALGTSAKLQEGELVLDPFAGRGALLAALARRWPCRYLGFELDPARVAEAEVNLQAAELQELAVVRRGDARQLPLPDDSVDVVVSDLPFGRKHGSVEANRSLYPAALREVARVLHPGGRGVVATGDESAEILDSALSGADLCRVDTLSFAFGGKSDDAGCKAVCFAKGSGDRDLFDWSLAEAEVCQLTSGSC
ncbi:THUMPD2 [Symbiodinium necroappetens]|uniref:THUMPD2 protein n=1 Tax=Symbiodinium necroappetens TaxID=1628268 RepID=A0A813AXP2_9DINO|nr:THUMPD2 [Symbiodinium necroappetens]